MTRAPLSPAPGQPKRVDYEYCRGGSASLLALFEPATGWRTVTAAPHRTHAVVAEQLRALVEDHYPAADVIRVVLDNVSTHSLAALFTVFEPERAWRIASKLELHPTPVHASWLNMIEIEWSVLARQCLRQRIGELGTLQEVVDAWAAARNARHATVDWRFRAEDARVRLRPFYEAVRQETTDDPS